MHFPSRVRTHIAAAMAASNSRMAAILVGMAGAFAYIASYIANPLFQWKAWWEWWDQSQYIKCAAALANLQLTQESYWYPLGYPILGALFYKIAPHYAFFVPNLMLSTGILVTFYLIARRMVSGLEAIILVAVFVVSYRGTLGEVCVIPWNSIPTQLLAYLVVLNTCFRAVTERQLYWAALFVGMSYLCRPSDAFCLVPLLAAGLFALGSWRRAMRAAPIMFCIMAAFVGIVLVANYCIFKSYDTPYDRNNSQIGLFGYPPLWKAYWLAFDGTPAFRESHPMLFRHMPWLWLAPAGALCLGRRWPRSTIGIILSIAATFTLYFNYNDLWPVNLYRYFLIHYLVWTLPLLWLMAYVGIRCAITGWWWRICLGAVVLIGLLVSGGSPEG